MPLKHLLPLPPSLLSHKQHDMGPAGDGRGGRVTSRAGSACPAKQKFSLLSAQVQSLPLIFVLGDGSEYFLRVVRDSNSCTRIGQNELHKSFSHCDDCLVSCTQFDFSFPTQRMKISTFLDVVATSRSQPKQISLCLESVWAEGREARKEGRVLNLERVSAVSIPFRHARARRTTLRHRRSR